MLQGYFIVFTCGPVCLIGYGIGKKVLLKYHWLDLRNTLTVGRTARAIHNTLGSVLHASSMCSMLLINVTKMSVNKHAC